mgnify:CR=1 FL=1
MFELDHALAQEIVDKAMEILPCNVNVMDSQGLILGSGEPARIDTRHEGAQLVLTNHRIVEIDEQTALSLKGVQPGVNVPLLHDQQLIGVLGLTGDPRLLRTYAELLRMTAEMLVSQRKRESDRHWRKQRVDDLLLMLLSDSEYSPGVLDESRQLGMKPELLRTPILIELTVGQTLSELNKWLVEQDPDSWCLTRTQHSLLWCPSSNPVDPLKLITKMNAHGWTPIRLVVGMPAKGVEQLRKGLQSVKALAEYGRAIMPRKNLLLLTSYRVPTLLWAHRDNAAVQELLTIVEKVQAKDGNGQLMQTLHAWCEHSGQIQLCADALGLHRNSLRYRMDRVAEITSLNLAKLEDITSLYLAMQLIPVQ